MSERHLSSQSGTGLITISIKVLQVSGLVGARVAHMIRTLANFDIVMYGQVLMVKQEISTLEIEIGGGCNNVIARRQPTARDLRLVMAISKAITDLEHASDGATKITKRTKRLMQDPSAHVLNYTGVDRSGKMTATILRHVLNTFVHLNATAAVSILQKDRTIDERPRDFIRELVTHIIESPHTVSVVLDPLFVTEAIECIGNHARNIAEFTIYIAKGTDTRHAGRETLECKILGEGE